MPKPKRNAAKKSSANTSSRSKLSAKKSSSKAKTSRSAPPAATSRTPPKSKKSSVGTTARSVTSKVSKAMSEAMSRVSSSARKVAKSAEETDFRGGAKRVGGAIVSATRNLTSKLHLPGGAKAKAKPAAPKTQTPKKSQPAKQVAATKTAPKTSRPPLGAKPASPARVTKRTPDVALDELANNYTPGHTSLKSSFREGGVARTQDQEMAGGFSSERWNDEDHFTNKSGDPRIGTHGRTYEPDEQPVTRRK